MAFFAIHGNLLPSAHDYEQAVKVYDEAYKHKRFEGLWRGLVNARDETKTVMMHDGIVKFKFHNTVLVEWRSKTRMLIRAWDSRSSVIFINRFTPPGVYAELRRGEIYICIGSKVYTAGSNGLVINKVDGKWVADESTAFPLTFFTLDKSAAAKIRQKLKPFREHRDALLRLRGGNHRADMSDEGQLGHLLWSALRQDVFEPAVNDLLLGMDVAYDDDILLKTAYLAGGAVKKVAEVGRPRDVKNPYAGRRALGYI